MKLPFNLDEIKQYDAVGFGVNAVDHLVLVPEYPAFDSKTRLTDHLQAAGGQTASAMVALQRLGQRTAYAGRFGSDSEGDFGVASLRAEGVNLDHAEMMPGARTQIAYILIDARNGERTVIWDRDTRLAYNADEAPLKLAARCRMLHMDAHDPPACASMAVAAHNAGAIVSLDVDNVYDGIELLLPHVDVLISSSVFPQRLTGITDPITALREISAKYGCTLTGMTTGERGALVLFAGQVVAAQAFVVPGGCRDTTGAGDAFHAGFMLGLLRHAELEDCLRMGNGVAALKCRNLGARTGLPGALELEEFLASNPEHLCV